MNEEKLETFSNVIGLLSMSIPFIYFRESAMWFRMLLGIGMAVIVSIGINLILSKRMKTESKKKKGNDDTANKYIIIPTSLFFIQLVAESERADSFSFEGIVYSLGFIGMYYVIIHFYEFFLEEYVQAKVSRSVRSYAKIALFVFILIVIGLLIFFGS